MQVRAIYIHDRAGNHSRSIPHFSGLCPSTFRAPVNPPKGTVTMCSLLVCVACSVIYPIARSTKHQAQSWVCRFLNICWWTQIEAPSAQKRPIILLYHHLKGLTATTANHRFVMSVGSPGAEPQRQPTMSFMLGTVAIIFRYEHLFSILLELDLIQTHMIQKPMLRVEVCTRVLRASQNVKKRCVPCVMES